MTRRKLRVNSRHHLAKLAAGGADIVASCAANVGDDAAGAKDLAEGADFGWRWRPVSGAAETGTDGVVGNEIDVSAKAIHQVGKGVGLLIRIVHALEQTVLDVATLREPRRR